MISKICSPGSRLPFKLLTQSIHFQHCTDHIMMGSLVGRENKYIQFIKFLYCKLPTIGKQLSTFPHKVRGLNRKPQRWESSVLPLWHPVFQL